MLSLLFMCFLSYLRCVTSSVQSDDEFTIVVGLKASNEAVKKLETAYWKVSDILSDDYNNFWSLEDMNNLLSVSNDQSKDIKAWLEDDLGGNISFVGADIIHATFKNPVAFSTVPKITHALMDQIDFVLRRNPFTDETLLSSKNVLLKDHQLKIQKLNDYKEAERKVTIGTVNNQKSAMGIPIHQRATHPENSQLVWGPGTFGYDADALQTFYSRYQIENDASLVSYETKNHGKTGGDNFAEGNLDVQYITSMGLGVKTIVSNTNSSVVNEWGPGFGSSLLDYLVELNSREILPKVFSLSLGSLSPHSCDNMCFEVASSGEISLDECTTYVRKQRQVCMFHSQNEAVRINQELMKLGLRGVTTLTASGDGGSHWSFGEFSKSDTIGKALNVVGCSKNWPTFPASSPFTLAIGGTSWSEHGHKQPTAWSSSGGGFSWTFKAPEFQSKAIENYMNFGESRLPSTDSFNQSGRAYPDVSVVAHNIPLCLSAEKCILSGGTSASAPSFAGILSLINDIRLNNGLKQLGPVAPRLYKLADLYPGELFTQIDEGDTSTVCSEGFPPAAGWDALTGLGRPIWSGFVKYLADDSFLEQLRKDSGKDEDQIDDKTKPDDKKNPDNKTPENNLIWIISIGMVGLLFVVSALTVSHIMVKRREAPTDLNTNLIA